MTTRDEIINKHAEAARQEWEAEEAKTAGERKAEALNAELGTLSAQIGEWQKEPTRYKAQLQPAIARRDAILAELETLGALPQARNAPAGNRHGYLVPSGTYVNFDPRSRSHDKTF